MTTSSPEVLSLLSSIHDSAMLIALPGWGTLHFKLEPQEETLRVREYSMPSDANTRLREGPSLAINKSEELARLGSAFSALRSALAGQGLRWDGREAQCVRSADGGAQWSFGDIHLPLTPRHLSQLLVTDALLEELVEHERAFNEPQGAFRERIGNTGAYNFNMQTARLKIRTEGGELLEFNGVALGSYSFQSETWRWTWGLEALPQQVREQHCAPVLRICAPEARAPGFAALWLPGYPCDLEFAAAVWRYVASRMGARGTYFGPINGGAGGAAIAVFDELAHG